MPSHARTAALAAALTAAHPSRKPLAWAIGATWLAAALSGCGSPADTLETATIEATFNGPHQHHGPDGFRNLYGPDVDTSFGEVLRWRLSRQTPPLPQPPLPVTQPQPNLPGPHLTWLGHATVLLRLGPWTLLTDPHFSPRASPVQWAGPERVVPVPLPPTQLPPVDAVLISHNHYDHLDEASVRALAAQPGKPPVFVVPLGLKAWFDALALPQAPQVVELDWWQSWHLPAPGATAAPSAPGSLELVLTPAHHWSSRTLWDRRQTLWGGFAMFGAGLRLIYTGDTAYAPDFRDIRQRLEPSRGRFDLALIPVGCYAPRDFMRSQHVNPPEAVRIFQDLGAERAIGVHWGTFHDLCDEPIDQAPRDLAQAVAAAGLAPQRFGVMVLGETRPIQPIQPAP